MDTFDNRINLLEEKLLKMSMIINALEAKNNHLEKLSTCYLCKNITELFSCSSCYVKVCNQCYIIKERSSAISQDREDIIFCRSCL